jgi:hypothetical protein
MNESCLDDCWVCEKAEYCMIRSTCGWVFDGLDCQMKDVCNRRHDKCPRREVGLLIIQEER